MEEKKIAFPPACRQTVAAGALFLYRGTLYGIEKPGWKNWLFKGEILVPAHKAFPERRP